MPVPWKRTGIRSGTPEERRVMISAAILKYRVRALERDPLAAQRGF